MCAQSIYKSSNKEIGAIGEQLAAEYLAEKGFTIREQNMYSRWGEIDIIAQKNNKIYFIEVKTRINTKQGMPVEAVRVPKLAHLMRTIQHYILRNKLQRYKFQLDVASVLLHQDRTLQSIKMYENVRVDRYF